MVTPFTSKIKMKKMYKFKSIACKLTNIMILVMDYYKFLGYNPMQDFYNH